MNESGSICQVQFGFTYSNDNVVCYTTPAIWLQARREDKRPEYKENSITDISASIFYLLADARLLNIRNNSDALFHVFVTLTNVM